MIFYPGCTYKGWKILRIEGLRHDFTLSFGLIITKQQRDRSKNNELWLEQNEALFYANIMRDNHGAQMFGVVFQVHHRVWTVHRQVGRSPARPLSQHG